MSSAVQTYWQIGNRTTQQSAFDARWPTMRHAEPRLM